MIAFIPVSCWKVEKKKPTQAADLILGSVKVATMPASFSPEFCFCAFAAFCS